MTCHNPGCLGNYDFDHIVDFAHKRFIEGISTIELMKNASSNIEREEIALIAMLDLNDDAITDLKLNCKHASTCLATNCRNLLKQMIQETMHTKE